MLKEVSTVTVRFLAQETERVTAPLTKLWVEVVTGVSGTQLATVRTRGAGRYLVIILDARSECPGNR